MSWSVTAVVAACLIVPLVWGVLLDMGFHKLKLARFFPLRDSQPPHGATKQPWDYQI